MRRAAGPGLACLAAVALGSGCQGGHAPAPAIQIVGESTKVRGDDAAPATSPLFDGARVRVRAARGEVVGLQVVRADEAPTRISLALDGAAVRAWQVEDALVVRPSTAMWGPSRGAGAYPDRLVPGVGGAVTAGRDALFDVAVPPATAPGDHEGTLTVGDRTIPVTLTVEPVTIPTVDAAPWVWAYYSAEELARGDGLTPGSDEARAAERRYQALFRSYGVYATPELTLADADRRADAVRGVRFVPVLLPRGQAAIEDAARGWAARLAGTGQRAFAIPIDEPRTIVDKLAVRVIGGWLHAAGGGVLLAVTDGPDWLYGDDVDVLVAPSAPGTGPPDRRWTYNGAPPGAGAMIVDTDGVALRTWGWIAWRRDVPLWYVWDAAYWRDRHNARRRGGAAPPFDPDRDAVTFDDGEDHGNLDGVLVYPGGLPSLRLAALRRGVEDRLLLEALAACAGRPAADAIAARLVPRSLAAAGPVPAAGAWPADEASWEAARNQLLDELVACAGRAPPLRR